MGSDGTELLNVMEENILIIIPTYNAKEGIVENLKKIQQAVPNAYILVVDDSSPDGTADLVKKHFANDKHISLLIRKGKGGRGSAILAGFKEGLKNKKINYFIEMDADLCHDPKYIKPMVAACQKVDVVIASRYLPSSKITGWNIKRKLMSFSINSFAKLLLHIPISDYTNGFRCYSRKAVAFVTMHEIQSRGYIVLSEIAYICYKNGFLFAQVPINFHFKEVSKSNLNWKEIKEALSTIIRLRFANEKK